MALPTGLSLPEANQLPTVELNYFGTEAENESVLVFDGVVDGVNHVFTLDTSIAPYQQELFQRGDQVEIAAFSDINAVLNTLYLDNELGEAELASFTTLAKYFGPYPNVLTDLTATWRQTAAMLGPDNSMVAHIDVAHASGTGGSASVGPISPSAPIFTDALAEARAILGDELVAFLDAQGVAISFVDFTDAAMARRVEYLGNGGPVLDFSAASDGNYQHDTRSIFINTRQPVFQLVYTIIHETGHAVNFLVQEKSNLKELDFVGGPPDQPRSFAITGAQEDAFFWRLNGAYLYNVVPSVYSRSNSTEWFAEIFARYILERGGRKDIIASNVDTNPETLDASLILVDPVMYLVMDRVVETIRWRECGADEGADFAALMATGLNDNFFGAAQKFVDEVARATFAQIRDEFHATATSITLESTLAKWRESSLITDYDPWAGNLAEVVRIQYEKVQRGERNAVRQYLPDADGNYAFQEYGVRYADFQAIQLVTELLYTAKTREEKVAILVAHSIFSEEALENLLAQIQFLPRDEITAIINDGDLVSEAKLEYERQLGEWELGMSGE